MLAHRYRLPLSVIVAGLAAGGATVLLRPRNGLIEPAAASATDYFTAEQLQRARAFRVPQRALGFASLGLSGGLLVWLVARPPRGVARTLERAGAAPVAGGAAAAAAYAVGAELAGLPLAAVAHQRARRVGLATQAWGPWLGDAAKAGAIGVVMTGMGGAMAVGLILNVDFRKFVNV